MDDNQEGEGIRLPGDVIGDIMSRLGAKTIGQLRLTMKSPLIVSLTTSQFFIQKHLQFAKGDINQYGLLVFLDYEEGDCSTGSSPGKPVERDFSCSRSPDTSPREVANMEIDRFSLTSFLDRDFSCLVMGDPFPERPWWLVSNANGIFCLHCDDDHLILWNPTTRGFKRTSSWNDVVGYPIRSDPIRSDRIICGFGFGELLNEYFGMVLYNVNGFEYLAFIYKAATNSWRLVASFRGFNGLVEERMTLGYVIIFVDNKFHWTVRVVETTYMIYDEYIVSFDPETELYRRLDYPREDMKFIHLGAMGTCLSLCYLNEDFHTWEVWMWEDDAWNIAFQLAVSDVLRNLRPMCRLPDGQLLLECVRGVVCCDVNDDTYRVIEYPEEMARWRFVKPNIYLETMVSPADLELVAGD